MKEPQKGLLKSLTLVLNVLVPALRPVKFTVNDVRSLFKIQISNTVTIAPFAGQLKCDASGRVSDSLNESILSARFMIQM